MSKYQDSYYKDVVKLLKPYTQARSEPDHLMTADRSASIATARAVALDFADLFAADNPPSKWCWHCGANKGTTPTCTNVGHNYGGFDREQFLAACDLT